MATLESGLQTFQNGIEGWNDVYTANWQLLNTKLLNPMTSTKRLGTDTIANESTTQTDPAETTAEQLTDSTGGTKSNTISDVGSSFDQAAVNGNFASIVDEINKLRNDNMELRAKLIGTIDYCDALKAKVNALLAALRNTGGCGVLNN